MKAVIKRFGLGLGATLLLASCGGAPTSSPASAPVIVSGTGHTVVTIQGTKFYLNGQLTSPGKPAEGLLLNTRMAQAIFDDENLDTVKYWAYPDTHRWDPQRNTDEFVAMIPTYAHDGIRMVTVGLQGGCPSSSPNPSCPGGDHPWIVSAFNADGSLKSAWMHRLQQVITAADHNGMVVMVQFFYHGQNQRLNQPDTTTAQKAAVNNITDWLVNGGYRNVLVETANECNAGYQPYTDCSNEANVIKQVQDRSTADGHRLAAAVSYTGGGMPSDDALAQEDFVLLHGNGIDGTALKALIERVKNDAAYRAHPTPIIVNEDSTSIDNMNASVGAGVSWGYLDTGLNNYQDGFQRLPVNWTINTDAKKAFFGNALQLAGPTQTSLVYSGPSTADYNDDLTLSATLTDVWGNALAGSALTFSVGNQSCSGITGPSGDTACMLRPSVPGSMALSISYAGSDLFEPASETVPVVIAAEQSALVYQGDGRFINGTGGQLAAVLTEDGSTPLGGRAVRFTLGEGAAAQSCTSTTDGNGLASCSPGPTSQPLGTAPARADFDGDRFYAAATTSAQVQVAAMASGLSYTGPSSGDFNDPVTLQAVLAAGEAPVPNEALSFTLGTKSCSGQTNNQGVASCSLTPGQAGHTSVSVAFAGDQNFQPSGTTASFVVGKEETRLAYTGETAIHNGASAQLSATLSEDGSSTTPLSGRTVSFSLGAGASAQSCTATTGATGSAGCSINHVDQMVGAGTVSASFAGDASYAGASDQPAAEILASTSTSSSLIAPGLAGTGRAAAPSTPWWRLATGGSILLLGLFLLTRPRRRPGEPASIIWRNRE